MKILIIKQTSLGDVIHSTLAIEAMREKWPKAEIHFCVDRACALAVENNPHINTFYYYNQQEHFRRLKKNPFSIFGIIIDILTLLKEMRKTQFDLAFDLQGIERSVFFLYFCKASKKFIKAKKFPFLKGFKNANKDEHAIKEICGVLKMADIDCKNFSPKLYLDESKNKLLLDKLPNSLSKSLRNPQKKVIIISPFTSWETKDYPVSSYLKAAQLIHEENPHVFIAFSATKEKKEELAFTENEDYIFNLAGETTISELITLIHLADLVIASEGATGHIAEALETPLIVVFGPTKPSRVGPLSGKFEILTSDDAQCLGCYKRTCNNFICMDFPAKKIADSAKKFLS